MKNNVVFRLLLALYILIVIFIFGTVIGCAIGLIDISYPILWITSLYSDNTVQLIVIVACAIMLIFSFLLMFVRRKSKSARTRVISSSAEGNIEISINALEEIVKRFFSGIHGVRSATIDVSEKREGICVQAKITIVPGTNVPELTKNVQSELKTNVEMLSGVNIKSIKVIVVDGGAAA